MKNVIYILLFIFSVSSLSAQTVIDKKNKDSFVLNGDLIEATFYHDNGVIAQTGFYTKDNKLHGEWISYDANGNKTAIANYAFGEKVGTWVFFQDDLQKEVRYENARIAEVKTWIVSETRVVAN